jgi:undecaprenyl-diphosphatase
MDIVHAWILGVIQGLTEFLPVSSSGHLIVFSWIMDGKPLPLAFNVALHIGTLSAILFYFWRDWLDLLQGNLAAMQQGKANAQSRLLGNILLGSVPAGIIGGLWEDEIEAFLHHPGIVCITLISVGWLLWWVDRRSPVTQKMLELSPKQAFLIGVAQAVALIPGTSRSGATILCGRWLGLDRAEAARFSFMLGTPAMAGAALLKGKYILASIHQPEFWVGVISSAAVGYAAISFLLAFLRRYGFGVFAVYRTVLAILTLIVLYGA